MADEFQPEDMLYRAITPENWHPEENRPISGAFKDEKLSVDWSKMHSPEELLNWWLAKGHNRKSGVAEFEVGLAHELNQQVIHDPLLDDVPPNPAHSLVVGKKSKTIARKFARSVRMALAVITT